MIRGSGIINDFTFHQDEFVKSFGRAVTGTAGGFGTVAILKEAGIIKTGSKEEDVSIQILEQETGRAPYSINISGFKRFVMSGFDPEQAKPCLLYTSPSPRD